MSSPVSFNQVAQLVKKFEKVGWDAARITSLGQASAKKFRSIEAILDGASIETALKVTDSVDDNTAHLRYLSSVTLAPTTAATTLAQANEVFTGYLDSDFQNWSTNKSGADTPEASLDVYEMKKNGTFADIFGSFGINLRSLCLSQGQIKEFALTHRHLLRQDGYATLFLFEVNGEMFVANVYVGGGKLKAGVLRFSDSSVWRADDRRRVVVPQLAL